ncbi:hypothetical protein D9M69_483180 [compost metagenome]
MWQVAHWAVLNTVCPRTASTLRLPSAARAGLRMYLLSEPRYTARSSSCALLPAFGAPSGACVAAQSALLRKPVPPNSLRMSFSKSCTSSKLAVQCSLPWLVPRRPCRLMVRRRPSPRWVKSHTMPSSLPSAWQLAQDM